jgi:hypothetical protein
MNVLDTHEAVTTPHRQYQHVIRHLHSTVVKKNIKNDKELTVDGNVDQPGAHIAKDALTEYITKPKTPGKLEQYLEVTRIFPRGPGSQLIEFSRNRTSNESS